MLRAAGIDFTQVGARVDEVGMRESLHAAAVPVEDAAVAPAPDAAPPPKKGGGGGGGLSACCNALTQNATMAPEPTKTYMTQAAAMCAAFAAQGKDKAAVAGIIMGALRGAGMPTACK